MKILELFAGSADFSKIATYFGHTTFTVDWTQYGDIDLVKDIETLRIDDIPFTPDVIWASPDCATYSIAGLRFHRKGVSPISDYAKKCDKVNEHFIRLLKSWLEVDPNLVFFIENPRGMLRKMPFMQGLQRYTIWYCQYGDHRAKPTDIWTNSKTWKPRPPCFNGNVACHHDLAHRGSTLGTAGTAGKYARSLLPKRLVEDVMKSLL